MKPQIFRTAVKWVLAAILVAAFGVILLRSREPRYDGHSLSKWIAGPPDGQLPSDQARAIRAMGTNALVCLIQWLQSFGPEWQGKAVGFLREHTSFEWNLLDPWAKPNRAIIGFRILGTNAAPAIPAVLKLMDNSRWEVRCLAIAALEPIAARDARAVTVLVKSLADPRPEVRMNSAAVLGEIGRGSSNALTALVATFNDRDSTVIRGAIWALGELGAEAEPILPVLLSHTNLDSNVRKELAHIVRRIKGDAAVSELSILMRDPDPRVRLSVAFEMETFTNNPAAAIPLLILQLEDSDRRVQLAAVRVVTIFGTAARSAVPALLEFYKQHSDEAQTAKERQRALIARALLEIDPLAAADAGINAKDYEEAPLVSSGRRARRR